MQKRARLIVLRRTLLGLLLVLPLTSSAQTGRQVAQKIFPSVVLLVMQDANGQPISLGSGFFVGDGIVATNRHVIEGATAGRAKLIGTETTHEINGVIATDEIADLVLLKIGDSKAPPLELGDSQQMAIGDDVYAVGNPKGLEGTFSQGIVSGIRLVGSDTLLQITAPISPGSSGGPIVDSQGKVIGVAVATFKDGQNLNFAVPVSYLKALIVQAASSTAQPISKIASKRSNSIASAMGSVSREGVVSSKFLWDKEYIATFTLSFENKLSVPVKNIDALVVFYAIDDSPLDVAEIHFDDVIPAGLARRAKGSVDPSVVKLTRNEHVAMTRIVFRVLDFDIVE